MPIWCAKSDTARQFECDLYAKLNRRLGVFKYRSTVYHSQANGIIERYHFKLKFSKMCRNNLKWAKQKKNKMKYGERRYRPHTCEKRFMDLDERDRTPLMLLISLKICTCITRKIKHDPTMDNVITFYT